MNDRVENEEAARAARKALRDKRFEALETAQWLSAAMEEVTRYAAIQAKQFIELQDLENDVGNTEAALHD